MRFSTIIASSMVFFAASGVALDLERRAEAVALGEELIARGEHLIARGEHLLARAPPAKKPAAKPAAPAKKGAAPPAKKGAAPAGKGKGVGDGMQRAKGWCLKQGRYGVCQTPQGSPECSPTSPCTVDFATCYWGPAGVLCQNQG